MVNPELVAVMFILFAIGIALSYYMLGKLQSEHNALLKTTTEFIGHLQREHQALLNSQKSLYESVQAIVAAISVPLQGQNAPAERKRPSLTVVDPLKPEDPRAS